MPAGGSGDVETGYYRVYQLKSDKDSHFTGAIAQFAKEDENLTGLINDKIVITDVIIEAEENRHFKVMFWKTDGFDDTDLDVDSFIGEVDLDIPNNGLQVGAANQYYLAIHNININYDDEDNTKELHVSLQCLSSVGATGGAAAEIVLKIMYKVRDTL